MECKDLRRGELNPKDQSIRWNSPETPNYQVADFLNVGLQTWNPLQFIISTNNKERVQKSA